MSDISPALGVLDGIGTGILNNRHLAGGTVGETEETDLGVSAGWEVTTARPCDRVSGARRRPSGFSDFHSPRAKRPVRYVGGVFDAELRAADSSRKAFLMARHDPDERGARMRKALEVVTPSRVDPIEGGIRATGVACLRDQQIDVEIGITRLSLGCDWDQQERHEEQDSSHVHPPVDEARFSSGRCPCSRAA